MQPRQILNATRRFLSVYSVMEHKPKIANFSHLIYSEVLSMHSIPIHLAHNGIGSGMENTKINFPQASSKTESIVLFFRRKSILKKMNDATRFSRSCVIFAVHCVYATVAVERQGAGVGVSKSPFYAPLASAANGKFKSNYCR